MPESNEDIQQPELYVITDTDFLLRRFPVINEPRFISFFKEIDGKKVPTSAAFKTKNGEDGLSVNIDALTADINKFVQSWDSYKVARFSASIPISNHYECRHNPNPPEDPDNPAHALIIGNTEKLAKKISKDCNVIEAPPTTKIDTL